MLLSICIPAYKRTDFLKRLLDSISIQDFKDYEVIVTDDSSSDEVAALCKQYESQFTLRYYRNADPMGTPENWNEAMRRAEGDWIKLMHDDDWFSGPGSLGSFAKAAKENPLHFIFSSYTNVFFEDQREEQVSPSSFRIRQLKRNPYTLLSKNIVGPPSVILHRNDKKIFYDRKIKWLVDIEFYTRRLPGEKIVHIPQDLVFVGLGKEQVTMLCHSMPEVEIPEHYYFLKKTGVRHLKNILVYDAWWRLLRNFSIRDEKQLRQYVDEKWPPIVVHILKDVNRVPRNWVRIGVVSKFFMSLSYLKNVSRIK